MNRGKKAALVLEDGSFFEGYSFGAEGEKVGELVFNTAMTGYQEVLSDPSYHGQMVLFTYPLIGNYGINNEDFESAGIYSEAVIVKEYSRTASGARCESSLGGLLKARGVPGIEGVDTRELTLKIRKAGTMKAVVSTRCFDRGKLMLKIKNTPDISGRDLVSGVTCPAQYTYSRAGKTKIAVIDCGVKLNTLKELAGRGCAVTVYPAGAEAAKILKKKPHGILISNGPGDPQGASRAAGAVKDLLGRAPLFGICFGHQLISLALGAETCKLKFGHHGANHPVKDLRTGRVLITSQNHNYSVREDTLPREAEPAFRNLYDGTIEGMRHRKLKIFSVQFHPEAGPGPDDAKYIFDEFIELARSGNA